MGRKDCSETEKLDALSRELDTPIALHWLRKDGRVLDVSQVQWRTRWSQINIVSVDPTAYFLWTRQIMENALQSNQHCLGRHDRLLLMD